MIPIVEQVLSEIICIQVTSHIWSGRKKLVPSDLKLSQSELPPADFASLGSKKICNPASLTIFNTLRKRADTFMFKHGVKFLGGYAIPVAKAQEVCKELDKIRTEFDAKTDSFINSFDKEINSWVTKHPTWESSIQAAVPQAESVRKALSFDYQAFQIKSADVASVSGLERAATGLTAQLYQEIAQQASLYWEKSLAGNDKVGPKAIRPLLTIRSKLEGLSFLDTRVLPLLDSIDFILSRMPSSGPIQGQDLHALTGIALILADEGRIIAHGDKILAGQSIDGLLLPSISNSSTNEAHVTSEALVDSEFGSKQESVMEHQIKEPPVLEIADFSNFEVPAAVLNPLTIGIAAGSNVAAESTAEQEAAPQPVVSLAQGNVGIFL
ncbi:hypothetical protein HA052_04850 [Chromobacterium haemolyticum]|uniref:DUF3150 domain-containing protein n=1 Tax=Chromobacterium fluminis TaxID=3044269 RepID=A0ABX0KYB9_9NEIS|nr:DUF3150 domain-containing protein [Chromobacterium haemolyticum]NHR04519.1 hypothetical protein [Chromobacterium haemolyticum]